MKKKNNLFIFGITLVATLGGLLFGYDTAVVSGTTAALDNYFVKPLFNDPIAALAVVNQYKMIVTLCMGLIILLIANFLIKLYGANKGGILSALLLALGLGVWYTQFWNQPVELTETMASSIKGFVISSALVGCIIGGAMTGELSQRIGRKNGLILAAFLFLISAIGSALPDTLNFMQVEMVSSLIFYRIIGGIGVGIASMLSPVYIAEVAPAEMRGRLVSFNQFAIIFGMLVVYFVNYFIAKGSTDEWINTIGWRWMFASEVIPCTLFLVLLFFVPKTPRYLLMKGEEKEAMNVIERLYGAEAAKTEFKAMKTSLVEKNAPWLSFGGTILIVGILLSFFQQAVGINVVLYYAPEIFRTMGAGNDVALMQTIIVGAINLAFTVVAILTVDRFGRKPLMIIGAVGMAISMTLMGLTFSTGNVGMMTLICMLLYTASFAMSWGPVCWVLLAEIFPNAIRGALSIAVAAQWLSNLVVSWTFPMMNESASLTAAFNHGFAYWIYGVMGALAALFVWRFVPETKGRTLEEIETLWRKK